MSPVLYSRSARSLGHDVTMRRTPMTWVLECACGWSRSLTGDGANARRTAKQHQLDVAAAARAEPKEPTT